MIAPKYEKRHRFTCIFTQDLWDRLVAAARRMKMSASAVLRNIVENWLEDKG